VRFISAIVTAQVTVTEDIGVALLAQFARERTLAGTQA
jgi:hypothetical protein